MKYYHGTDYESGIKIIKTKKFGSNNHIWKCSQDDTIYVVSEEYDNDRDSAIRLAIEEGQITAAHNNSKASEIFVFEFETETECFKDDVSCENMNDCYQINKSTLNSLIKSGEINVRVLFYRDAYEPNLRPFYLMGLVENQNYVFNDANLERICANISKYENCWFYDDYVGSYENFAAYNIANL